MKYLSRFSALTALAVCLPFAASAQSAPALKSPITDQQSKLIGTGQKAVTGYTAINVQICVSDSKPATPAVDCATHQALTPDAPTGVTVAPDGTFTATLATPLKVGQYVYAVQTTTGTATTVVGTPVQVVAITAPAFDSNMTAPIYTLSGTGQLPSDLYTSVQIYVCHSSDSSNVGKDCSAAASPFQAAIDPAALGGSTAFVLVGSNGHWSANLKTPLPVNETVWLWEGAGTANNVSAAAAASLPVRPTIDKTTLKEGGGVITGTATRSAGSGDKVLVQLCAKAPGSDTCAVFGNYAEVGTDGNYTLQHAMTEGEVLTVRQRSFNPSTPIKTGYEESESVVVGVPDNERVSIDFIAGILLSQQQQSFSQANLFLGLNMDLDFFRPGYYTQFQYACLLDKNNKVKRARSKPATSLCGKSRHPGINGFFQARLSAIPVNSTQTTATTTTAGGAAATTDAYDTFLVSRKSSHFEMGLYVPTYFGNTHLPTSALKQSLFVAPIARFGFNTLVSDDSGTNNSTAPAGGAATVVTSTKPVGVADPNTSVYSFGLVGVRVGAADMKAGSPHIAHYLDLGIGKFSNLRNLYCSTKLSCLTNGAIDPTKQSYYTPYRFVVEGALELDGFLLGFSINKGQNFSGFHRPADVSPANPQITQAADDVRFLFGYKFDVRKLLDAVKRSSNFK